MSRSMCQRSMWNTHYVWTWFMLLAELIHHQLCRNDRPMTMRHSDLDHFRFLTWFGQMCGLWIQVWLCCAIVWWCQVMVFEYLLIHLYTSSSILCISLSLPVVLLYFRPIRFLWNTKLGGQLKQWLNKDINLNQVWPKQRRF